MVRMCVRSVVTVICCVIAINLGAAPVWAQSVKGEDGTETSELMPPPIGESAAATEARDPSSAKPVTLPEVIVKDVHHRDQPDQESVKEIPGTVNVVTREEIQRTRPKNADELLRRIPGVNIMEEYGQGLRPNIGIRGLNPTRSRNVLVLVDEIPIQPALFGDPAARACCIPRTHRAG